VSKTAHSELILDQFTRQALAFSTAAMITDDKVLARIVQCAGAQPVDTVLDVACGPKSGCTMLQFGIVRSVLIPVTTQS
jgi:hypothetical protein